MNMPSTFSPDWAGVPVCDGVVVVPAVNVVDRSRPFSPGGPAMATAMPPVVAAANVTVIVSAVVSAVQPGEVKMLAVGDAEVNVAPAVQVLPSESATEMIAGGAAPPQPPIRVRPSAAAVGPVTGMTYDVAPAAPV